MYNKIAPSTKCLYVIATKNSSAGSTPPPPAQGSFLHVQTVFFSDVTQIKKFSLSLAFEDLKMVFRVVKRVIILLLLVVLITPIAFARECEFSCRKITTLDGLSQNDVLDIIQDSRGFMWIATNDGLCRYDGYEFRRFTIGDLGLKTNLALSLAEDKEGNIWIGTAGDGLYCYLREKNHFYHYMDLADVTPHVVFHSVKRIAVSADGAVWVHDNTTKTVGRLVLDIKSQRITKIDIFPPQSEEMRGVNFLEACGDDLYVGNNSGLYRWSSESDNFVLCSDQLSGRDGNFVVDGEVIYIARRGRLLRYNTRDKSCETFEMSLFPDLICWSGDRLWMAGKDGVYAMRYDSAQDSFSELEVVDEFRDYSPMKITKDHTGGVWVGFRKAGLRRYEINKRPFYVGRGLGNDHIQPIFPMADGRIFFGTEGSGLFVKDSVASAQNRRIEEISNLVYSVDYAEKNGRLYVSTSSCLSSLLLDEKSNTIECKTVLNDASIRKVLVDGEYLWAGSYSNGLLRQNLESEEFVSLTTANGLPSMIVRNVMLDSRGNIWVCTSAGVAKIRSDERFALHPNVESVVAEGVGRHYTISIMEDSQGDIWFGTLGYGLYRLRESSAEGGDYEVWHYTTRDGLSGDSVKAIEEDADGRVWISTNRGLCSLQRSDDGQQMQIRSYDIHYGLQDYEFCELSSARLGDGTLLFGGVAGYNYFNPSEFVEDRAEARPAITDFRVHGRSIFDDEALNAIAPEGLDGERGVVLAADENSITIKFAALHFSSPTKYEYRYQMEGVDRGWIHNTSEGREVSYTNLHPGRYRFYLSVANADGVWSHEMLVLPIEVEYPFYLSWYALLLYALLLSFAGFYTIRHFHDLMERRNEVRLAKMERRKTQEMLEMRTRFFTNVSHEFRTPLTLILSPLQRLLADEQIASNEKWTQQLNTMSHNGDSLMRLINEFLSYTKQESGALKLQLSSGELQQMCRGLFEQFAFWAEQRGIELRFEAAQSSVKIDYDPYLMEQVIYNIVSNAIKYTPSGGVITFSLRDEESHVILAVKDSGCGISKEQSEHIFEQYFSRMTSESKQIGGTGVGLYLTRSLVELHGGEIWFESQEGEGTTFFVKLPRRECVEEQSEIEEREEVAACDSVGGVLREECESRDGAQQVGDAERLPTLLIVDDNVELLNLLESIFESSYRVLRASDGVDGWGVAREMLPDIIISDVMMPRMDGLELCDKIKQSAETSHIPLVLLSAKARGEDMAAGLRLEADGYCPKPFNNDMLVELVGSILRNRRKLARKFADMKSSAEGEAMPFESCTDDAMTATDRLFLKRLTEYVEANLHSPDLVVNSLCDYMGVTPLVLNKKLKSLTNMTANVFIRTIRLRRAAQLLKTSRYTIADVTYDVGFSDLRYFRECFKKEFGVLPQEYKDQNMAQEEAQKDEE